MAFIENKVADFEKDICMILARLAHHVHPNILKSIQQSNLDEYDYFKRLFSDRIEVDNYLFDGSACVFPGVRRSVSGKGKRQSYNKEYRAIIDANVFPRYLWCFLENGKGYSARNWRDSRLGEFELVHIFTHKESEIEFEQQFFNDVREGLLPYGEFTCGGNVCLLPKGTVRPTDNSSTIKAAFYRRYIELYEEAPLNGRGGFKQSLVPGWYRDLRWNEPVLPSGWESNVDKLLKYRTKRITDILERA